MDLASLLLTAVLFGGMVFYSFGFAPVLFKLMPVADARPILRGTFPYYYLAIIGLSFIAALAAFFVSPVAAILIALIFASTVYARQLLMPKINQATDKDNKPLFKKLHGFSVVIQLIQILLSGWALVIIANA